MTRIIVAAVFSLGGSAAMAGTPLMSQLQPGDRIHVAYHSRGCFHDRNYDIDFQRGDSVTARSAGHSVTLSAREVAGLDKLFQFYRSKPRGGCTTEDDITISQFHGAEVLSSERYIDGSCATYQMKNVTRFYEIAKKLGLEHDIKT
jgi:hypothetical protein